MNAKTTGNKEQRIQRLRLELLLISGAILFPAMWWTLHIGQDANNLDHRLYHVTENLEGIHKNIEKMEAALK